MNKPSKPAESELRDYLAKHLDIIEPNLRLIKVEYQLRNEKGAAGFVDILARNDGGLVVIELKRSDQTARQALHELEKYVGLLAEDRGIRTDQLRCILVSTDWRELAVPFSRYVSHVDFYLTGLTLLLSPYGAPASCVPFEPLELTAGAELCPMYLGLLFSDRTARDDASVTAAEVLADVECSDYILINLDYVAGSEKVIYPFALFIVLAAFSTAMRDHIRSTLDDGDPDEEYDDEDWWPEQLVHTAITSKISADEISYEAPGQDWPPHGWAEVAITGAGKFADPVVWGNDQLSELVAGFDYANALNFEYRATPSNKPAWGRLRGNLLSVISEAGAWPTTVSLWLDEAQVQNAEVWAQIYCPMNILFGLEAVARDGDESFVPSLSIARKSSDSGRLIMGGLVWDGESRDTDLPTLLHPICRDFMGYLTMTLAGGAGTIESQLLCVLGLEYEVVEFPDIDTEPLELSVGSNGNLERQSLSVRKSRDLGEFLMAHPRLTASLLATFDSQVLRV